MRDTAKTTYVLAVLSAATCLSGCAAPPTDDPRRQPPELDGEADLGAVMALTRSGTARRLYELLPDEDPRLVAELPDRGGASSSHPLLRVAPGGRYAVVGTDWASGDAYVVDIDSGEIRGLQEHFEASPDAGECIFDPTDEGTSSLAGLFRGFRTDGGGFVIYCAERAVFVPLPMNAPPTALPCSSDGTGTYPTVEGWARCDYREYVDLVELGRVRPQPDWADAAALYYLGDGRFLQFATDPESEPPSTLSGFGDWQLGDDTDFETIARTPDTTHAAASVAESRERVSVSFYDPADAPLPDAVLLDLATRETRDVRLCAGGRLDALDVSLSPDGSALVAACASGSLTESAIVLWDWRVERRAELGAWDRRDDLRPEWNLASRQLLVAGIAHPMRVAPVYGARVVDMRSGATAWEPAVAGEALVAASFRYGSM